MDEKDVIYQEEPSDLSTMSDEELNAQLEEYNQLEAMELEATRKGYSDKEIDDMLRQQAMEDEMEDKRVSDLIEEPKEEEKPLKERVDETLSREKTSDQIMALLESHQWTYEEAYKLMRAAEIVCNDAYWRERKMPQPTQPTQTTIYYTGNPQTKCAWDDDSYGVNSSYGNTATVNPFSNSTGSFKGMAKEARKMSEEDQKKFDEIKKKHE